MYPKYFILLATISLLIGGCSQSTPQPTHRLEPTGLLTPYLTITPSSVQPTSELVITLVVTPAPSPTPFMHEVKKDETMLGIAFLYGLSLEDLKAANPGVDPQFLSVGTQLIVPIHGDIPVTIPTITPVPVVWQKPDCYRTGDGGAWCILMVTNQLESNVENLSAWIGIFSVKGENIANNVAYADLNLLRPGDTLPLLSYFPPPLPEKFDAQGKVLSGFILDAEDTRYLDLNTNVEQVATSPDGSQATVRGEVILPVDTPMPSQLWAMILAYDMGGKIIGSRKWESSGETEFNLTVYSLGGIIDHIEVLTESKP
jgi:LysM repeat protein